MVAKLSTTINKIQTLSNSSNDEIINEFLTYMKNNGFIRNGKADLLTISIIIL
jgi:flagellar motor switch protein FliG